MAFSILVVDDEKDIRDLVSGILEDNGYQTETAGCYIEAIELIEKRRPNLVLLDVWLGDGEIDGLRLLEVIKKENEFLPVIIMSGHGTIETAVLAIKKGAYDFIEKPFDSRRLTLSIEKAIEASKLQIENANLKIKAKICDGILGKSQNAINIRQSIEKIALLNGRCVILGPSGSDKETVAKEIHRISNRSKSQFVNVNCKSFSPKQLEAEIFGLEIQKDEKIGTDVKIGILEKFNGGTVFIDEIATTSYDFQHKFLKLLKDSTFSRIGSQNKIRSDIRIIAGLPLNINELIARNLFIDELFCRLNANLIKIAPLRARREDISYLLNYYMDQSAKANNTTPRKFSSEALGILNTYSWPGDVQQLKNTIDWILTSIITEDDSLTSIPVEYLPREIIDGKESIKNNGSPFISIVSEMNIKDARGIFEKEYFAEQLKKFAGNISQTAKAVGMERSALHRKLKSLDILDPKMFKDLEV